MTTLIQTIPLGYEDSWQTKWLMIMWVDLERSAIKTDSQPGWKITVIKFPGEFLMYGGQSDEIAGEF